MANHPTQRFSTRVENYIKYRPHYPPQVLAILRAACGLTPDWIIADIGSGTGISSELFLRHGNRVYGVEPNAPMRESAEILLAGYPRFVSIDGTAEATTLPDASIDMAVAGQAFHWFDQQASKREFRRILRPGGWAVLFWNERRSEGTPFLDAYDHLLRAHAPEYLKVNHRNVDAEVLAAFFAPGGYREYHCENVQRFDFAGLLGRLLSSSYSPEPDTPGYAPMYDELERIFNAYQQDGHVRFEYDTQVYVGRIDQ